MILNKKPNNVLSLREKLNYLSLVSIKYWLIINRFIGNKIFISVSPLHVKDKFEYDFSEKDNSFEGFPNKNH